MLWDASSENGRLVNKMANKRQDRVSGPALSHPSASASDTAGMNGHPAAARGIVLSLCLRTLDSSGSPAAVSWAPETPAAALAVDIVTASGGAPDASQGIILPSRFVNPQSALLAARRLQWALEGMAETTRSRVTAAIAIYSLEDPAAASAVPALESLAPGQVLLSSQIADAVQQLPGLVVNPSLNGSWRALQWQAQNAPASLAVDEQSVLGLIRGLGRQDPCAPRPEPAPTATPSTTGMGETPGGLGRSVLESEAEQPFWKKPWIIVSAAGAVVVLVAALVIPAMVSGKHSKTPAADAAPTTVTPAPQSTTAPQPTPLEKPHDQKPLSKIGKQSRTEAKAAAVTEPPPQPKPAAGPCVLTEGEIPRSLDRAQSLMYAGKLEAAQDAYQRLVGCPSVRDKAAEGLRLVKQRIAAQGSSEQ